MQASPGQNRILRFGVFEIDLQGGELRRAGLRQKLRPQAFEVLKVLLEHPGQIVTRDELQKRLWSDRTFVDYELALKKCVNRIREVLGDSADNPRFIETVPRKGYRFIAPVRLLGEGPEGSAVIHAINGPVGAAWGEERPSLATSARKPTPALIGFSVLLVFAIAAIITYLVPRRNSIHRTGATHGIRALAVLPFENLSPGNDSAYFAEGMTDELITQVAKNSGVRVISRTSVMPYEGKREPLREIANALNVDAVIEGTVLHSGTRVRITAQLIQVDPEKHLWADSYDREERDVLALQSELARNIAHIINTKVTQHTAVPNRPMNVEALEAYLRGRYWWHRRGREAEAKGLEYFQRAVELDPSYAPAWAGVADSYLVMAHHGGMAPKQAMPKAESAALKALNLDDSLAEAHASVAAVKMSFDWDYSAAEKEFQRAIELDANYATAHHWYAHYLVIMGRFPEALSEIQTAHQLDPYSIVINTWWGRVLYYERDFTRAAAQFRSMLELGPDARSVAYQNLAAVQEQQGNLEQAIECWRLAFLAEGKRDDAELLARSYRAGGPPAYWRERIDLAQRRPMSSFDLALLYALKGNEQRALSLLDAAYNERWPWLNFMDREPVFDLLRIDPRFQKLLQKVRLK